MDYDHTKYLDVHDKQHLTECYPRPSPAPYGLTPLCENYDPPQCEGAGTLVPCS